MPAAGADFCQDLHRFLKVARQSEDVALMRRTVGPQMGVKAAGGIHSYKDAMALIAAGATRIGASRGVAIVEEAAE